MSAEKANAPWTIAATNGRRPIQATNTLLHLDQSQATYLLQKMMFSRQIFRSKFGVDYPLYGPFGKFEFDLRFELSPPRSLNTIHSFTQAYDRARAVGRAIFPEPSKIQVLISLYSEEPSPPYMRLRTFLENQLPRDRFQYQGSKYNEGDAWFDPHYIHWIAYSPRSDEEVDTLLWLALSQEMGIKPSANADLYFVDTKQGFYLHPYDDRGMDLVSVNRSLSQSIFNQFNDWLLDYDREKMNAVFAN